jgi:hypothetical protein
MPPFLTAFQSELHFRKPPCTLYDLKTLKESMYSADMDHFEQELGCMRPCDYVGYLVEKIKFSEVTA